MIIRKDTLLYKLTQLHWFLLLTIIALAMFGTLILFLLFRPQGFLGRAQRLGEI